jgi:hypothetical protein
VLVEAETVNRVFEALDLWLDISNSPHFLADSQVVPQKAGSLFILMLNKEDLFDQKIEQEARPRLAHIISSYRVPAGLPWNSKAMLAGYSAGVQPLPG